MFSWEDAEGVDRSRWGKGAEPWLSAFLQWRSEYRIALWLWTRVWVQILTLPFTCGAHFVTEPFCLSFSLLQMGMIINLLRNTIGRTQRVNAHIVSSRVTRASRVLKQLLVTSETNDPLAVQCQVLVPGG